MLAAARRMLRAKPYRSDSRQHALQDDHDEHLHARMHDGACYAALEGSSALAVCTLQPGSVCVLTLLFPYLNAQDSFSGKKYQVWRPRKFVQITVLPCPVQGMRC